ncbi:hypothetical protein D3C79_839470 [compost metagenome]
METQDRQITMIQHADAVLANPERMRRVVDDLQPIGIRHTLDALDIAGNAIAMHRHDRGGCRRDGLFDAARVQVIGLRVDVHEDRLEVVPQERMGGSHKGVRRGDDFTGDTQSLQGRHQGHGAVAEQREMLDPQVLCQCLFQLLMERAAIGQPLAVPYLLQIRQKLFQRRE